MSLEKGSSQKIISENIERMEHGGHSHEQSVAAALHTARETDEGPLMEQLSGGEVGGLTHNPVPEHSVSLKDAVSGMDGIRQHSADEGW